MLRSEGFSERHVLSVSFAAASYLFSLPVAQVLFKKLR